MLAATPGELRSLGADVTRIAAASPTCVFGGRDVIAKSNASFNVIDLLAYRTKGRFFGTCLKIYLFFFSRRLGRAAQPVPPVLSRSVTSRRQYRLQMLQIETFRMAPTLCLNL